MNNDLIKTSILKHCSGAQQAAREALARVCNDFNESGLADTNFIQELCSGSKSTFWSRVSEALLANQLQNIDLAPKPPPSRGGPDFWVAENGRKIWIEVICPEPTGIPLDWIGAKAGQCMDAPDDLILLRWTSAIKEKAEKLLGSLDGKVKGYIEKGIVAPKDAYVIAVNGCQLRRDTRCSELNIIKLVPFAVEAVFPIGTYKITIDRNTRKQISAEHQYRSLISTPKGKLVPTDTFLDARFRKISAIWAVDIGVDSDLERSEPMIVVHNLNAVNAIPTGFLPAHYEYVAPLPAEGYEIEKLDGNLPLPPLEW